MSGAVTTAVTVVDAEPAGEPLPELPAAEDRGALTIAEKVVERVAGYAVTRVEGASAAPRRVLGVKVGETRPDSEASVDARVEGRTAVVSATVAITWPHPVRTVAARLRRKVRDDVARMTGVDVAQIDLDVVQLSAPTAPSRRVR